ncbi:hypothetical protein LTR53_019396, partial [Teratosphaeriaceae sp. CCFEE 6253]
SMDDASEDLEAQTEEGDTAAEDEDEGTQTPQAAGSSNPTQTEQAAQTIRITQQQILQLLSQAGIRGVFQPSAGVTTRAQARRLNAQHVELAEDDDEVPDEDEDDETQAYLGYGA